MMVRGSCWLWLGFSSFGQLNFTGGSPGSGALCLFSLHKDFRLGPPLWRHSCTSSPLVTPPGGKTPLLHVPSGDAGSGLHLGNRGGPRPAQVPSFPGRLETLLPLLGQRTFADCYTRWAAPDSHLVDRRKQQSVFCYPAPERAAALGIWGDL